MKPHRLWLCKTLVVLCGCVCAMPVLLSSALADIGVNASAPGWLLSRQLLQLAQYRQCSQRVGPFATQTTAWQRWREARSQGYAVSNGVVPCYDASGTRGYCFNVFFPC